MSSVECEGDKVKRIKVNVVTWRVLLAVALRLELDCSNTVARRSYILVQSIRDGV
jgi:hypothetical protein